MNEEPKYSCQVYEDEANRIVVFDQLCKSCALCLVECEPGALYWSDTILGIYGTPVPECRIELCTGCKLCEVICPDAAIFHEKLGKKHKAPQVAVTTEPK